MLILILLILMERQLVLLIRDHPFKVVIEAHADEISWFVNYITPEGLIYLKRNGGVDHQIAPAQRVFIHGKKGTVKAVFGWPAIHTRLGTPDQKEPQPKTDNLWLDCGARNRKEVEAIRYSYRRRCYLSGWI